MKTHIMAHTVTCALCWSAATAHAGSFEEATGKFVIDAPARHSFDNSVGFASISSQGAVDISTSVITTDPEGALEGDSYLVMGGAGRAEVYFSIININEPFAGKRVRLTLWQQPRGTDARASIMWHAGDARQWPNAPLTTLGEVAFHPTGRHTSDGWIEMATGEFDLLLGGTLGPTFLKLSDRRFEQRIKTTNPRSDPRDRVRVDAFELHVVGDAAVPDAACTMLDEEQVCGAHGVCLFARCVDAASVWGSPPSSGETRRGWSERLAFVFETFSGSRNVVDAGMFLTKMWESLAMASARDFWKTYARRIEASGDPHAKPVIPVRPWKSVGAGGVCLGPGEADLMPNPTQDAGLMVFRESTLDNVLTQSVQVGDILTRIDGVPWRTWVEQAPVYLNYSGDPTDRDLIKASRVLNAAITTGANVTFERCAKPDQTPCTDQEVETIEVDLAEVYGADVWEGKAVDNLQSYWCDWRFDSPINYPRFGSKPDFYTALEDDVRHIMFETVPGTFVPNHPWVTAMKAAMAQAPAGGFLLDMRWGRGGNLHLMSAFVSHFFARGSNVRLEPFHTFPPGQEDVLKGLYRQCEAFSFSCQHYDQHLGQDSVLYYRSETPRYPEAPVAILAGRDISAHDTLLYLLKNARSTPARVFGYATSFGGFGHNAHNERVMGELQPMTLQATDTLVTFEDGTESPFLTGTGVTPDEIIYQKQSDALRGVDTVLARANAWLQEQTP